MMSSVYKLSIGWFKYDNIFPKSNCFCHILEVTHGSFVLVSKFSTSLDLITYLMFHQSQPSRVADSEVFDSKLLHCWNMLCLLKSIANFFKLLLFATSGESHTFAVLTFDTRKRAQSAIQRAKNSSGFTFVMHKIYKFDIYRRCFWITTKKYASRYLCEFPACDWAVVRLWLPMNPPHLGTCNLQTCGFAADERPASPGVCVCLWPCDCRLLFPGRFGSWTPPRWPTRCCSTPPGECKANNWWEHRETFHTALTAASLAPLPPR